MEVRELDVVYALSEGIDRETEAKKQHGSERQSKSRTKIPEIGRETDSMDAARSSSFDMSLFRPSAAVCCSADDVISTCCCERARSESHARPLQRERG